MTFYKTSGDMEGDTENGFRKLRVGGKSQSMAIKVAGARKI